MRTFFKVIENVPFEGEYSSQCHMSHYQSWIISAYTQPCTSMPPEENMEAQRKT